MRVCVRRPRPPGRHGDDRALPEPDAADQGRGEDAQPIKGLGDQAYASTFGSVWVYVDDISLFTQWYSFDGTDEENLPKSKALAKAVVDELAEVGGLARCRRAVMEWLGDRGRDHLPPGPAVTHR